MFAKVKTKLEKVLSDSCCCIISDGFRKFKFDPIRNLFYDFSSFNKLVNH